MEAGRLDGDAGHRRAAIQAAATQVDLALQARLSSHDISGTDIVTQAFRLDAPKPKKPGLRFPGLTVGSERFMSAHQGAMNFGQGCFMAVHNLATHDPTDPDEDDAMEMLAALSVLAHWIDGAAVQSVKIIVLTRGRGSLIFESTREMHLAWIAVDPRPRSSRNASWASSIRT
jgi:hypothetical protein